MALTSTDAKILQAFNRALRTAYPSTKIAFGNMNFTPPRRESHFRTGFLPNPPRQEELGDTAPNVHTGAYQVSVFAPSGEGAVDAIDLAGSVAAAFPRGRRIIDEGIIIRIDGPPSIAPALQEPDWYQIPVSINYVVNSE